MIKFKNMTPHEINIVDKSDKVVANFPSEGSIRIGVNRIQIALIDGIAIYRAEQGETNLPDQEYGVLLIVSKAVREAFPDRKDLHSPGDLRRDANGVPIGCLGLDCNL